MCGISGLVLREGERADRETLLRLARTMERRGPDAEGALVWENLGLAHRRLKIIDLSDAANQPMLGAGGKLAMVFNGEIYNFRELRAELEALGHRFSTQSDTEVLLRSYEQWGEGSFRRLNGMFAFAVLDRRGARPVVYLVRDRFGIKPLFYASRDGKLAFASELKPLLEVPWIGRGIAPETLFCFLKFSHVPTPHSILQDVQQLRPGAYLRFEAGISVEGTYWNSTELCGRTEPLSEADALGELDRVLRDCVRRQIVSDVPLGCFLSGGVDSSLLTIAHASLFGHGGGRPIQTFSVGYRESEFDESGHAREIAEAFGTEHHELILGPSDFYDLIPEVCDHFDQPLGDPTLLSTLLLARFARQKVTVALSGDGGDELFLGYPHQRALMLLSHLMTVPGGLRTRIFRTIEGVFDALPTQGMGLLGHRIKKLSAILQFRDQAELFQYFVGTIGPLRIDRLARLLQAPVDPSSALYGDIFEELAELPTEEKVSQAFIKTFLLDTVLAKTDRAGMACGLEARVPFLDNEMAEFSARVPLHLKLRGGTSKFLLRHLLERWLKDRGLADGLSRRPKQGFSIPLREWLRTDLKYLLDEYLNPARLRREGILSPTEVPRLVLEHVGNRANHSHLLWSLVTFQMWKERYLS